MAALAHSQRHAKPRLLFGVGLIGEGLETMLSLRRILPTMPMIAALSADNLGLCAMPPTIRHL